VIARGLIESRPDAPSQEKWTRDAELHQSRDRGKPLSLSCAIFAMAKANRIQLAIRNGTHAS